MVLAAVESHGEKMILPPDAAVREYKAGLKALGERRYEEAVSHLREALRTGHTKPADRFGSSRTQVSHYEPNYWLGVALMGTGETGEALASLRRAREDGLIMGWPEAADLLARIAELERREAADRAGPTPGPRIALVPTATPPPATPDASSIRPVVAALAGGNWTQASQALASLRERYPASPQADLLEAALFGTRFVLEGRTDDGLRKRAKDALAAYRSRGGSRAAEEIWLSPALSAALGD